jgi:hypothetical protein
MAVGHGKDADRQAKAGQPPVRQVGAPGQGHHRHQTGVRHEIQNGRWYPFPRRQPEHPGRHGAGIRAASAAPRPSDVLTNALTDCCK